jgi:hypothetical protein
MVMPTERGARARFIIVAATALLWPALWNGYPLVFSDTGTYLSQAIEHYAGWDRPIFYSLFLLPLHMTLATWPAIVVQALLTAYVLHLVRRTLLPGVPAGWLLRVTAVMTIATTLPWFVSQLMPDVFTGVLVLVLALLMFVPDRLTRRERIWLTMFAAFMIAVHQSHVLLALALLLLAVPFRLGRAGILRVALPLALAVSALVAVNLVAFGRASVSPFGNVFLLARVIYDGPGMHVLRRDCPTAGWRLCAYVEQFPTNADDFLWRPDGPVARAGGAKAVSAEANAIIATVLRREPGTEFRAAIANTADQLGEFASGDGLDPWPTTVAPTIKRDFPPSEAAAYAASRQAQSRLSVPLPILHTLVALAGAAGCCGLLLASRRELRGFAAAALLAVLANAAITGALSGPHDRYQSRIMWLPPLVTALGIAAKR